MLILKFMLSSQKIFVYSSCLNITVQINIENMSAKTGEIVKIEPFTQYNIIQQYKCLIEFSGTPNYGG